MVRPRKKEKKIQYTIMLEPSTIDEIKQLAERADVPAGTFARNLLMLGLDDARLFDKAGITRLIGTSRKKMDQIKKRFDLDFDGLDIFDNSKKDKS